MSHYIDTAAFAKKPAWHNLGKVLVEAANSQEMIVESGLNWEVLQSQAGFNHNYTEEVVDDNGVGFVEKSEFRPFPNQYVNYRSDTGEPLGIVGKNYSIVQNREAFSFLDSLIDSGEVRYESAGALKGGKIVWMLAQLPGVQSVVDGDDIVPFVLLTHAHDGTMRITVTPTAVRVVCWNTLSLAIGSKKTRHVGVVADKLTDIREFITEAYGGFSGWMEKARQMAKRKVEKEEVNTFLREVFGEKTSTRQKNTMKQIIDNLFNERNCLDGKIKMTAWGLLNAVTEYNDHQKVVHGAKANDPESQRMVAEQRFMNSFMDDTVKGKAWELAEAMFAS